MKTRMPGIHQSTYNHFLERSSAQPAAAVAVGIHLLVVIDHRMARIYKTEFRGSVPEQIVPYDAAGSGRHLHHIEDDSNGQRQPELKSFYTAVAKTLERAQKILLFGSGARASSAMDHLLCELDHHHKEVRDRVIGSIIVDEQHLTEHELLAKARQFYSTDHGLAQPGNTNQLAAPAANGRQSGSNHHQRNGAP